jgi:hypothetical protein
MGSIQRTTRLNCQKATLTPAFCPTKEGGFAPNYTLLTINEMTNGFIVEANVLIGNVEHLNVITTIDTILESYGFDIDALMTDSAFATGSNIAALENRGIEFLSPLPEVKCENNPALRADPTTPVAADQVPRLTINLQSKTFDRTAFVYDAEIDKFYCPAGKTLSRESQETRQTAAGPVPKIVYFGDDCEG